MWREELVGSHTNRFSTRKEKRFELGIIRKHYAGLICQRATLYSEKRRKGSGADVQTESPKGTLIRCLGWDRVWFRRERRRQFETQCLLRPLLSDVPDNFEKYDVMESIRPSCCKEKATAWGKSALVPDNTITTVIKIFRVTSLKWWHSSNGVVLLGYNKLSRL